MCVCLEEWVCVWKWFIESFAITFIYHVHGIYVLPRTMHTRTRKIQALTSKQARDSTRLACRRRLAVHTYVRNTLEEEYSCALRQYLCKKYLTKISRMNFLRTFLANDDDYDDYNEMHTFHKSYTQLLLLFMPKSNEITAIYIFSTYNFICWFAQSFAHSMSLPFYFFSISWQNVAMSGTETEPSLAPRYMSIALTGAGRHRR